MPPAAMRRTTVYRPWKACSDSHDVALHAVSIAALHVALAWPGAGTRGIIAEEIQPWSA